MSEELIVLLGGSVVGMLRRHRRGRLTFEYEQEWQDADDSYPLSLSMPLTAKEHGPEVVEAFVWGLLPDNERVIANWAQKFQVSARNAFALISHVGEDCAGAAQFVLPERLDAVLGGADDGVEWLDEHGIAQRLRALRQDHAAWRLPRDTGQFSLAGAQPKTALLFDQGKWGVPSGRIPTTHIFKPPTGQFDGHAENEHICLTVARAFGLPTATSRVMRFEDEVAIVVDRYDRIPWEEDGKQTIVRVHQEDMCQALGVMPTIKYQNQRGPGVSDIVQLLRATSTAQAEDTNTFIDAVAFNWLIAGTDAHAKNYSVLLSGGPTVRLAPLYDVASVLPYDEFDIHRMKLSMKVGGAYPILEIGIRQWQKLARDERLDADGLIARLREMAARLPDEIHAARARSREDGLDNPTIDRLVERLTARAAYCTRALTIADA